MRLLAACCAALALTGLLRSEGSAGRADDGELRHLVILHTNDLHGQVEPRPAFWLRIPNPPMAGGLRRVAGAIGKVRAEVESRAAAGERIGLLVLDAGDWSQGTPEGALAGGRPFLEALAEVGYDALCIGNHEFDHGVEPLATLLGKVPLPAVLAGVACPDAGALAAPYRVFERMGLRIAVVGLVAPNTPWITHPSARDCRFDEPATTLAQVRDGLEGVDWVLPLTHLGLAGDRALARAHPDLDLIVGGHSHDLLAEGEREGETWIVQAGSKASVVGRVDVWFDEAGGVARIEAEVLELYSEPAAHVSTQLDARLRSMLDRTSEEMDVTIGHLAAPLTRAEAPLSSSPSGNLVADLVRARTSADVGLHNRGGLRANLYQGVVTRRDVFDVLPFSNHVVVVELSGAALLEALERAIEGPGRRGPEVSGLVLSVRRVPRDEGSEAPPSFELVEVRVGDRPLEPERVYTVATNSFLAAGGDGYTVLAAAEARRHDPILLRELLEEHFRAGSPVTPPSDQRYTILE